MATRKFLYFDAEALTTEQDAADDISLGKITASGIGGIAFDAGSQRISNVATPTTGTDAANKNYVDAVANGLDYKESVRVATTANTALTGTAPNTIDGVTLAANDRILVKDQTAGAENGIYFVQTLGTGANGTWVRSLDADTSAEVTSGMSVWVSEGTVNADSGWSLATNDPIVLGTTALVFTQTTGLGQIAAGSGLTKTGNTLNVGAGNGITVNADDVAVRLATNSGLEFATGQLQVDVDTARGINRDATGVYLGLNGTNPGLAFSGTYVDVKYDGARAITAGASGVGLNLNATNPGLAITTNALDVKLDTGATTQSLTKDASGVKVLVRASAAGTGGLQVAGSNAGLEVKAASAGGLELTTNGVEVKIVSTDRLSKGASGLDVVGVPTLFEIGGSAVSANVTAANLGTLTGGSNADALHSHAVTNVAVTATTDATGVTKADGVYYSGNGIISKGDNNKATPAKSRIIGVATATVGASLAASYQTTGILTGALTGATAGVEYYLSSSGAPVVLGSLGAGVRRVRLGIAVNATDLLVSILDRGQTTA